MVENVGIRVYVRKLLCNTHGVMQFRSVVKRKKDMVGYSVTIFSSIPKFEKKNLC